VRPWTLATLTLTALLATSLRAQMTTEGLPPEAPRTGTVVTIDVSTNQAYLFRDGALIRKSPAATGSDKVLRQGRRVWWFRTPRGRHTVVRKVVDPVWTKPDWAFIEEGKKVPPPDSPLRKERGTMGKYALDLGDRVMIHGTNDPKSIGRRASHGCIRLPNDMLKLLWKEVGVGTEVYIFDSAPRYAAEGGLSDLEMKLDESR
jgi:L,D-transpeptidase ErfK/SrfK